jgi:putative oxidoreductase
MHRFLVRYETLFFTLLRIVAGFLFTLHGAQKLFGFLGKKADLSDPMMLAAGIIEFAGGILIAIGLFTTPVAFLASGEMAVAYFKAHAPQGFWPTANHGELAVLYCFLWLFVAAHGAGPYSVDAALFRPAPRRVT